jgi:hypothetical protein
MAKSKGAKIEKRINSKHIAVYHSSHGREVGFSFKGVLLGRRT